ncbi:MAG: ABC transporter permease [Deltaproteobacteria bacterium]|nr:MAG: ABC transporter permease [Deltaproteobacteria bacterium]
MWRFLGRRLLWTAFMLWLVATSTFFLMRLAPGGPFDKERSVPPEILENLRKAYQLDKPLLTQYSLWLGKALKGDLGPSMSFRNHTVNDILRQALPVSAALGLFALLIALFLGVLAGVIGAIRQNQWLDYSSMTVALVGISIPNFILALVMIQLFVFALPIFPPAGWSRISHIWLPGLALALPFAGRFARLTRTGMLDVIHQDYIRTARAKGLSEWVIVVRHALRGGLLPTVSFLGPAAAGILTGSLVIEQIFAIPGMGRHFVKAAFDRDYTLVMGTTLLYFLLLAVFNLLVDVAYAYLDPRIRYE